MKRFSLSLVLICLASIAEAQVIAITVGALISAFQPQDVKTLEKMEGQWAVKEWMFHGEDRTADVEGVSVLFEKCTKMERAFKFCSARIIFPDGKDVDVLEYVKSDEFNFAVISKKESKAQAETTKGINPNEVPEDPTFQLNGKKYRYIISLKKKTMHWEMMSLTDQIDNRITFEKMKIKKKK